MQTTAVEVNNVLPLASIDPHIPPAAGGGQDTRGKHRIMVELKRLEQETRFLQEELAELENTEGVSTACQELLQSIQHSPDPLLPVTNGPVNPSWERWFEGPFDAQGSGCWIL